MRQLLIYTLLLLSIPGFSQGLDEAGIKSLADQIEIKATTPEAPVSMNSKLFSDEEGSYLVVKVKIHENWHIYAYVPEGGFFIQSELKLDLPEGIEAKLIKEPKVHGYEADPQIMLYKGELLFVYELSFNDLSGGEYELGTTLSFQPCDPYACLPPDEIIVKNTLTQK